MPNNDKIHDEYELPVDRKKRLFDELDEIDTFDDPTASTFLVSNTKREDKEKKKASADPVDEEVDNAGLWLATLSDLSLRKIKGRAPKNFLNPKEKKKKKKHNKNDPKNFKKEFEPEVALVDNLLIEQTRFVDSLQQKYDRMEGLKSTARGMGKFTTDLISNINQARQLAAQLVDKKISVKKTIADLEMKERKEIGAALNDSEDLNNYAATFLKNIMSSRADIAGYGGDISIEDVDDSTVGDVLESSIDDERSADVAAYLKYENAGVKVICLVNPDDLDDYEFIAETKDGEILTDYPLPDLNGITLNRSTMIATDAYGQKYQAEFRE